MGKTCGGPTTGTISLKCPGAGMGDIIHLVKIASFGQLHANSTWKCGSPLWEFTSLIGCSARDSYGDS